MAKRKNQRNLKFKAGLARKAARNNRATQLNPANRVRHNPPTPPRRPKKKSPSDYV